MAQGLPKGGHLSVSAPESEGRLAAPPRQRGAAAALPCRDSNNCISPLTGADAKRGFALRQNADGFMKHWGRNHTLFFTTTDGQGLHPKEYAKRWHSWKTNAGDWVRGFLKVLEPQKNGRPHYHNLAGVDFDTRPDEFDWEAFTASCEAYQRKDWVTFRAMRARYVASAAPELRELWSRTREEMKAYGLGRCEILPVRKQGAISEYIGKYLDKGTAIKPVEWKGVRRVEMDRVSSKTWRECSLRFSWASPGGFMWRQRLKQLAFALGLPDDGDISGFSRVLGPRWGYTLRGAICTATQQEWEEILHVLAVEVGKMKRTIEHDPIPRWSGVNVVRQVMEEQWERTLIWADGTYERFEPPERP